MVLLLRNNKVHEHFYTLHWEVHHFQVKILLPYIHMLGILTIKNTYFDPVQGMLLGRSPLCNWSSCYLQSIAKLSIPDCFNVIALAKVIKPVYCTVLKRSQPIPGRKRDTLKGWEVRSIKGVYLHLLGGNHQIYPMWDRVFRFIVQSRNPCGWEPVAIQKGEKSEIHSR